jgi:hypothetical protein
MTSRGISGRLRNPMNDSKNPKQKKGTNTIKTSCRTREPNMRPQILQSLLSL